MGCSKCGRHAVINQDYSGLDLCRQHFKEDILHKAKKTVRQNHWLIPGKRYAVALSGGPSSCALLDFMHTLVGNRKDISLIAITISQKNAPEELENAKEITRTHDIPWFIVPEDPIEAASEPVSGPDGRTGPPFQRHGSIERRLANMAEDQRIDAIAVGYTLEDHAEWVLWNAISGTARRKPFNSTGIRWRTRIIRPFMHIPGHELALYSRLFLTGYHDDVGTKGNCQMCDRVCTTLARFYRRHPGAPYALVNIGEHLKQFLDPGIS